MLLIPLPEMYFYKHPKMKEYYGWPTLVHAVEVLVEEWPRWVPIDLLRRCPNIRRWVERVLEFFRRTGIVC